MDREQEEMQFLGPLGIYMEAYKLIFSNRKIFSQITLSLILPLSFLILIQKEVSNLLFNKIINDEINLSETQQGTTKYNNLTHIISSEWTQLFLFKATYLIFLLIFSLLSTAAVVYTIATVYTARHVIAYRKVMSVVPKVWKRLVVTFLWTLLAVFAYHVVAFFVFFALALITFSFGIVIGRLFVVAYAIVYLTGLAYLSLLWLLAGVVSVLEDSRGFQAMRKSKGLMRGKMWTGLVAIGVCMVVKFGVLLVFELFFVDGNRLGLGLGFRFVIGVLSLLVSVKVMLMTLVVQTIIYFVCKSYHHENIDKSALSDHLEAYLGEYVPLTAKDVQLQHFEV